MLGQIVPPRDKTFIALALIVPLQDIALAVDVPPRDTLVIALAVDVPPRLIQRILSIFLFGVKTWKQIMGLGR